MSQFCTPFDPHATTSGTLVTQLGKDEGVLLILNDSAINVIFILSDGQRRFSPAQSWRRIDVPPGNDSVGWQQQSMLSIGVPNSQIYCESFAASEDIPEVFPASLVRGVIGSNAVATSVVNTGNTSGTIIVQGSSTPGTGSIQMNNDGSRTTRLLDNGISNIYENLQNGTNLTSPTVVYGLSTNLFATNFYGSATLNTLAFSTLGNVSGVATSGTLYVGQTIMQRQHVQVNTAVNIINVNAPITGQYRLNAYFNKKNATASAVTFSYTYQDPDDSTNYTRNLSCDNVGAYLNLKGVTTIAALSEPCFTVIFPCVVGQIINVSWTDPTGTANDYVTAILECLL